MKVFPSLEQVVRRKSCASGAPVPGSPCSTAIHHRHSPEPSSSSSCWTGCGAKCSRPSSRRRNGRASARSGGQCARLARRQQCWPRRRCGRPWRPRRRQRQPRPGRRSGRHGWRRQRGLPGSPQPPRERSCRPPGASTRVLEYPGRTPEPRVLQVTQRRKVRAERLCDPIRLAVLPRSAVEHGNQQLVSNRDGGPDGLDVINVASRSNTSGSTHGRPSDEHLSLGQDTRPCGSGLG